MIITDICNDVFNIILNFLDVKNLLNASEVSKKFNTFSKSLLMDKIKRKVKNYFDKKEVCALLYFFRKDEKGIITEYTKEDEYKYLYNAKILVKNTINNIYDFSIVKNNIGTKKIREIIERRMNGRTYDCDICEELKTINKNIKNRNKYLSDEQIASDIKIICEQAIVDFTPSVYYYILHNYDIHDAIMHLTMEY